MILNGLVPVTIEELLHQTSLVPGEFLIAKWNEILVILQLHQLTIILWSNCKATVLSTDAFASVCKMCVIVLSVFYSLL